MRRTRAAGAAPGGCRSSCMRQSGDGDCRRDRRARPALRLPPRIHGSSRCRRSPDTTIAGSAPAAVDDPLLGAGRPGRRRDHGDRADGRRRHQRPRAPAGQHAHPADRRARARGTYVVEWLVVGGDAHPARGAFLFSVGEQTRSALPGGSRGRRDAAGAWRAGCRLRASRSDSGCRWQLRSQVG